MTFLLIMSSRSYLRNAICSFIQTEIEGVDILAYETVDKVTSLNRDKTSKIDLVLLYGGNGTEGSEALSRDVKALRAAIKDVPIVILGEANDANSTEDALKVGAQGFVPTSTPAKIVKHALPLVAAGGVFLPSADMYPTPGSTRRAGARAALPMLKRPDSDAFDDTDDHEFTSREIDVLALLGVGLQNKLIAYKLGLKESTVKVHVRHIMKKLKATSRTQAALFAQRHFPITSPDTDSGNGPDPSRLDVGS